MVQWLGLSTITVVGLDLIPGRGTKILQTIWYEQQHQKKKKNESKFIYKMLLFFSDEQSEFREIKWLAQTHSW